MGMSGEIPRLHCVDKIEAIYPQVALKNSKKT